jgi:hypothetical protein
LVDVHGSDSVHRRLGLGVGEMRFLGWREWQWILAGGPCRYGSKPCASRLLFAVMHSEPKFGPWVHRREQAGQFRRARLGFSPILVHADVNGHFMCVYVGSLEMS